MKDTTVYRLTLGAATAVSLAGNSQHAVINYNGSTPLWFTVMWSVVPPLALPLTVHLAGVLARSRGRGAAHTSVVTAVVLIAITAFVISFVALRDLTVAMGSAPLIGVLFPILVDATASAATVALLVTDRPVEHVEHVEQVEQGAGRDVEQAAAPLDYPLLDPATRWSNPAPLTELWSSDVAPSEQVADTDGAAEQAAVTESSAVTSTVTDAEQPAPLHLLHTIDLTDVVEQVEQVGQDTAPTDEQNVTVTAAHLSRAKAVVDQGGTRSTLDEVALVLAAADDGMSSRQIEAVSGVSRNAALRIVRADRDLTASAVGA